MSKTQTAVAEIVTFRLIEGADPSAFVAAARALEPKLLVTGEAKARVLSCDDSGLWTDHIIWTSLEVAKATAETIMSDPLAAPMMRMIDPDHVTLRHAPIYYQQGHYAPH